MGGHKQKKDKYKHEPKQTGKHKQEAKNKNTKEDLFDELLAIGPQNLRQ